MRIEAATKMEREVLHWAATLSAFQDYDAKELAEHFAIPLDVAQGVVVAGESMMVCEDYRNSKCDALEIPETNAGAWIAKYLWGYLGDDAVVIRQRSGGNINPRAAAYCDRVIEQLRDCPAFDVAIEAEIEADREASAEFSRAMCQGASLREAMSRAMEVG